MALFAWRGATRDAETASARAAAGAAFLDARLGPGWEARIKPERLDIGSPFHCILGQLGWTGLRLQFTFADPWDAVKYGFSSGPAADWAWLFVRPRTLGRSFELLTEAWRALLAERRAEADEVVALVRRIEARLERAGPRRQAA